MFTQAHRTHPLGRKLAGARFHLLFLGLCTLAVIALWPAGPSSSTPLTSDSSSIITATKSDIKVPQAKAPAEKVQVELFVMSQCPDARFCETAFEPIIKKLPSLVSLRTEYIAQLSTDNTKVTCMHGDRECEGNKQQLCLEQHTPADKNQAWFFTTLMCHMGGDVSDSKHLKACMDKSSIPADVQDKVLKCAASSEGTDLQVKSAQEVKARDVKKSCTVYIGGKRRCIRDGGRWYDCPDGDTPEAFVKSICDAYKAKAGVDALECAPAAAAGAAAGTPESARASRMFA